MAAPACWRLTDGIPGQPFYAVNTQVFAEVWIAPDFDEFCRLLNAHAVEFVIVGAYALAFHGAPRLTGDLDVVVTADARDAAPQ